MSFPFGAAEPSLRGKPSQLTSYVWRAAAPLSSRRWEPSKGSQQIARRHTTFLTPSVTTLPAAPVVRSQPTRHPTEGLDVWWESSGWDGEFVVEERPPCHLLVDIFMLCSPCREITATPSLRVLPCEGSRPSTWIS